MSNNNLYIKNITFNNNQYKIYDIQSVAKSVNLDLKLLPYSMRILFENVLRCNVNKKILLSFTEWLKNKNSSSEIPFLPARVLMQDFTGVPAIVDLAAMRDAMKNQGRDPLKINPMVPVDLIIDHSLKVDFYGNSDSYKKNIQNEIIQNLERYQFLKWGQEVFNNFRVIPPGKGICHQVNLEHLAQVVFYKKDNGNIFIFSDTVVGTDSHTTMINALGILGWGVGGIEAESVMLGQILSMILPEVIGIEITGELGKMSNATDLVLTITEILRKENVVGKFIEFYGQGLDNLNVANRATVANMAPEFGATCAFFPIDEETIKYLKLTGKKTDELQLIEYYSKSQLLWRDKNVIPQYTKTLKINLSEITTSIAGPKKPHERLDYTNNSNFQIRILNSFKDKDINKKYHVSNTNYSIGNGDIMIAAITSCTNTSNPYVIIGAGILAKKAVELGLTTKPWIKTSLAPGSKVVSKYLDKSNLKKYLETLGFYIVGYGCTTCIGNSGNLKQEIIDTINKNHLTTVAVLSGNRNFEGRINTHTIANYLMSPLLVIAYAIAGNITINLKTDPIGKDLKGTNIYLKEIWPSKDEIEKIIHEVLNPNIFLQEYKNVFLGDTIWSKILVEQNPTYKWNDSSTYIKLPPYFCNNNLEYNHLQDIQSARILAVFGDFITTDHISPAGEIDINSPAGKYLLKYGVKESDFNSYGARRGNHEVMIRGTFSNKRLQNLICKGKEGGITISQISKKEMNIFDAAMEYKKYTIPLVIFAGKEYGSGSSRDWAAKGTKLLGIKAVFAESFERIHRSNLVGMGILPLKLKSLKITDLNIDGSEYLDILFKNKDIKPLENLRCKIYDQNGNSKFFDVILQIFTENEVEYIKDSSILHTVMKKL